MERIHIKEVAQHPGQQVKIAGFVQTIRDQSKIAFLIIRDSSGTVQTVITKDQAEALATVKELTLESVVEIVGTAKEEKQAPGGYEVAVESLIILSRAEPELPIPILEKGSQEEAERQKRLDWRWLDLRKPEKLLIFKVWTLMEQAFREYWTQHDYVEIHSPKLIGAPSESGAEVFEVKYF
ncbi:MAG: OB-fold nucleic acid binding domain-containing protein, partial [Patescibacteria group bacterium]